MWCIRVLLAIVLILNSSAEESKKSDRSEFKKALVKDCEHSYSTMCLKLDIVSWVDKLNEDEYFSVLPGVTIVRENVTAKANNAEIVADLARDFPNDQDARLDAFLLKKVYGYLNNHSIRLSLFNQDSAATGRKGGGGFGGGGKKGDGGMGMILAMGAMMKGTLMALALGALAALAGKALMTGLISLLLSAMVGLKSLSGGGGKTTYEVVSKPVYTHSSSHSSAHEDYGHHGHSGYGRSFDDVPLPMGLQPEYKPA
ncbi:uncharacterized protein [Leptinotarsa decemlineata]|uniref:uncharacterized protein n=1 Tax=Leptinotarsa decemlineata TaxID=7539 RepID=UPI000C25429F|nr:uncharacterized protein LOC111510490 [Leptinotarsa decemlineata]